MMTQSKIKHKGFWQLADPKIWVASTVPMLAGAALAFALSPKRPSIALLLAALIAIYLIEIGKNALNEYIDFRSGVDPAVDAEHRTPFSGGKKTIVDGLLTPSETLFIAGVTFAGAALIGLVLILLHDFRLVFFGAAGLGLAIAYSLPPFKLAYRGLGEITVGFVFGPLLLNGMFFLLAGYLSLDAILLSLPLGLLIANVLVINEFPDYEADLSGNKRNWVVRLGKKRAIKLYTALFAASVLTTLLAAVVLAQPLYLLALLPVPLMFKAVKNATLHHDDISKLIASNAATVQIYFLTGLLFVVSIIIYMFLPLR